MKSIVTLAAAVFVLSLGLAPQADALCGFSCIKHKLSQAAHSVASVAKKAASDASAVRAAAEAKIAAANDAVKNAVKDEEKKAAADALAQATKARDDAQKAESKALADAEKARADAEKADAEADAEAKKEAVVIKDTSEKAAEKTAAGLKVAAVGAGKIAVKSYNAVRTELDKGCGKVAELQKKMDDINNVLSDGSAGGLNKEVAKLGLSVPGGKTDVSAVSAFLKQQELMYTPGLNAAQILCNASLTSWKKDLADEQTQFNVWCGPQTALGQEMIMKNDIENVLKSPSLSGEEAVAKKYNIPLPHSHEDPAMELEANKLAIGTFYSACIPAPVAAANKACQAAQLGITAQGNIPQAYAFVKKHS